MFQKAVRYRMHVLKYKTCAASDCNEKFEPKSYQQKYCSDQCRWRESKRKTYKKRAKNGQCPQCGDKLDNSNITYCTKCQDYFQDYYLNRKTTY